jgi:hypothetical protein
MKSIVSGLMMSCLVGFSIAKCADAPVGYDPGGWVVLVLFGAIGVAFSLSDD